MNRLYVDPNQVGSFGGIQKFARSINEKKSDVKHYLLNNDTYTKFKPARIRFPRRKILAYKQWDLLQADLLDVQKYSKQNKGFRYILVATDTISKFVFYVPIKSKASKHMKAAFSKIFKHATPRLLLTDKGTEFLSRDMKTFFAKHGVKSYYTYSGVKASQAERQIRSLKQVLERLFYQRGSYKYIDVLDKLADSYNNTIHSRTRLKPVDVDSTNEMLVFDRLYKAPTAIGKPKFAVGDSVRISFVKGIFAKGYEMSWTNEIFEVIRVKQTNPIVYYLKDLNGQEIHGAFYAEELNRVRTEDTDLYDIERIIKKRKLKNGQIEYLVKFVGYDGNYWVNNIERKK